jgi:hypothetical protein
MHLLHLSQPERRTKSTNIRAALTMGTIPHSEHAIFYGF